MTERRWDDLTDADLDDVFGKTERLPVVRREGFSAPPPEYFAEEDLPPEDLLPTAEDLAEAQNTEALYRLHADKSGYARFSRLQSVHALTGSLAPEEILMVGAQVGAGKSLFCQNLFDDFIAQGIATLYIGTEQSAHVLKVKHACIRCGVSPRMMIKPEPHEIGTTAYKLAEEAVEAELEWMRSPEIRELALYANTDYVNRAELKKWITGGVRKYGISAVIVDHIDQVQHGDGRNTAHETTGSIQLIHDLCRKHEMPAVVASQLKRPADPFKRHAPPDETDFANSSGKERIMALGLGLWRPLRNDLTKEELRDLLAAAKQGNKGQDKIYMKDTMGVRLLKDRLGDVPGKQVLLHVGRGGRLADDEALTHGIKTSYAA